MIDSHAHLDACEGPAAELVAEAHEAGIDRILAVGIDPDSCRAALAAARAYPGVRAAIGRHPNLASDFDAGDLEELETLAAEEGCVAIGETGFDFFREGASRVDQRRAFHAQIELARSTGKPLVIHTRAAEDETLSTLAARADGLRVVMHCFSMPTRLDECLERGWWISFAGNVTYPRATELQEAARRVPADRLLVETDAPYLSPQPVRGKPNRPAQVVHTARFVAELRECSYEELEAAVERNAAEVLGW